MWFVLYLDHSQSSCVYDSKQTQESGQTKLRKAKFLDANGTTRHGLRGNGDLEAIRVSTLVVGAQ